MMTVQDAIEFALDLETTEEHMGEQAAIMFTCEQHGINYDSYADVMMTLPKGCWWANDRMLKAEM